MSTEHVTDEELDEVERLDREATSGPWSPGDAKEGDELTIYDSGDGQTGAVAHCELWRGMTADAAFIALARTLLPRLAAAERARRAPVDVEAELERAIDVNDVTPRGTVPLNVALAAIRPHVEERARLARELHDANEAVDHYRGGLHKVMNGEGDPLVVAAEYSGQDPAEVTAAAASREDRLARENAASRGTIEAQIQMAQNARGGGTRR